jgi:hypothetical protein
MADEKTVVTKKTSSKGASAAETAPVKKTAAKKPTARKASTNQATTKKATTKKAAAKKVAAGQAKAPSPAEVAAAKAAASKPASGMTARKTPEPLRKPKAATPARTTASAAAPVNISADEKAKMIQDAAYYRAEKRNFEPGHEHEDWLAAEQEVEKMLREGRGS